MKGHILVINEEKQMGAIAMHNGQRALFRLSDWTDVLPPQAGMQVEFALDPDQKRARQVQMSADVAGAGFADATGQRTPRAASFAMAPKRKSTLTLLTLFLGSLGGHRFYLGAWGWGLVQLIGIPLLALLFLLLLPPLGLLIYLAATVLVLVEVVRYILMTDAEFDDKLKAYQAGHPGAFGFFW